jgi:glutamine amidotransferase-like uncharacterized protein
MKEFPSSPNPPLSPPKIGIFVGAGASHSWLWFVDLLDQWGLNDVRFINEKEILIGALEGVDSLMMSGGDTFAMARSLGAEGSRRLKHFIEEGGLYIGTCAGAYLPLRSSMAFLNQFNWINVKISNISRRLSESERGLFQEHACTPYGCEFVYHVAREDVLLEMEGGHQANGSKKVIAPLYGGPSMLPSEDMQAIATYRGFTEKTKFLVREDLAEKTLHGNIAASRKRMGKGYLYIFGPHFEHPNYPEANGILARIILREGKNRATRSFRPEPPSSKTGQSFFEEWRRELSHSRMVAFGLEMLPIRWMIGNKWYEPEKIRVFLEALWRRLNYLESGEGVDVTPEDQKGMINRLKETTGLLRTMKKEHDRAQSTNGLAEDLFLLLKKVASDFLTIYFRAKRTETVRAQA